MKSLTIVLIIGILVAFSTGITGIILYIRSSQSTNDIYSQRIDALTQKVDKLTKKIDDINLYNKAGKEDFALGFDIYQIEVELGSIQDRLTLLEKRVNSLNVALSGTSETVSGSSDVDLINTLQERVAKIEDELRNIFDGSTTLAPEDKIALKQAIEEYMTDQRQKDREKRIKRWTNSIVDTLATELELDEFQKEKVAEIVAKRVKEINTLRQKVRNGEITNEEMRSKWTDIAIQTDEYFSKILSSYQYEKYEEWKNRTSWWWDPKRKKRQDGSNRLE